MQQRFQAGVSRRSTSAAALSALLLAALSACGGGGDSTPATVSSMSVSATKYGAPAQVTVTGTHLGNLSLTAPGCKNIKRLTASPTASSDTTAYFSCTPSAAYTSTISAVTFGTTVDTTTLTVLPPVVTMAVSGGGVNGNIVFSLRGNQAPITVDNFLAYVNSGFYSGLIFHRVVPNYVVQGGGYGTAYFSDRGRRFQADRGRQISAVGDAPGRRASSGLNVSQSSTISLKRAVVGPGSGLGLVG